jgi:hypothetical protein
MPLDNAALHHAIMSGLIERGCAPSVRALAEHFSASPAEISAAMKALAEYHKQWWGNCAWCSLGVAKLAGGTCTIRTTLGMTGRQVTVRVENGAVLDKDYVVHFPIPMTKAWDNVVYTCSLMLLFESEADVDAWCATHCKPKGDVRPIEQVWRFAAEWYGRHLDRDWRKWTSEEAAAIFARNGLTGPVWEIPVTKGRF